MVREQVGGVWARTAEAPKRARPKGRADNILAEIWAVMGEEKEEDRWIKVLQREGSEWLWNRMGCPRGRSRPGGLAPEGAEIDSRRPRVAVGWRVYCRGGEEFGCLTM